MRRPVGAFAAAFGMLSLLGLSGAAAMAGSVDPAGAAGLPQLELSTSVLTPGETVAITGTDWPAHKLLQAAVCGGGPLAVSSECDLTHAIGFGSADNGVVAASLTVTVPPVPCPCVILVTQVNPSAAESLPVTIEGAPTGSFPTPPFPARPTVRVSDVQVVSQSSWKSWFGAAAPRELIVTVHNAWIRSGPSAPGGQMDRRIRQLRDHEPDAEGVCGAGGTAQLTAPFSLSTFAHGQFAVVGKVTGAGFDDRFADTTSTTPWGLYILLIVLAVGILFAVGAFIGRRADEHTEEIPPPPDMQDEPTAQLIETGV